MHYVNLFLHLTEHQTDQYNVSNLILCEINRPTLYICCIFNALKNYQLKILFVVFIVILLQIEIRENLIREKDRNTICTSRVTVQLVDEAIRVIVVEYQCRLCIQRFTVKTMLYACASRQLCQSSLLGRGFARNASCRVSPN